MMVSSLWHLDISCALNKHLDNTPVLLQDYSANPTGSAVVPWMQSPGYAQIYLKYYQTNDGHADSTQVLTASNTPFIACLAAAAMSL